MTLILIDCENFSHNCVLELFADYEVGPNTHAHGFCDFSLHQSWTKELFLKYNITPHQVFHANKFKNAADMALARFAMERIYAGGYNELVIASSDSDFCDLMLFAKSRGLRVVCYASNALLNPNLEFACSELRLCKAKTPERRQQQSKAQENAEQIRGLLAAHGGRLEYDSFVRLARAQQLISKNKSGAALRADLASIGLFAQGEAIYIDETAAKQAEKSASAAAQSAAGSFCVKDPTPSENPVFFNKSDAEQSAATRTQNPSLHKKIKRMHELFFEEIFAHKGLQTNFAQLLRERKLCTLQTPSQEWFSKRKFVVFKHEGAWRILPEEALENGQISDEYREKISTQIAKKKQQLQKTSAEKFEAYIKARAADIAAKSPKKSGLFSNVKRLFGLSAAQEIEQKVRKSLEYFWQSARRAECDIKALEDYLSKAQICAQDECAAWLRDCGLALLQNPAGGITVSGRGAPRPFDEQFFAEHIEKNLVLQNINLTPILHPREQENPEGGELIDESTASARDMAQVNEAGAAPSKDALSTSAKQEKNEPKSPQNAPKRSTQQLQMLHNFAPAAKAIFWRKLNSVGADTAAVCEFFNSLKLPFLQDFCPTDLKVLGLGHIEHGAVLASANLFAAAEFFEHHKAPIKRLEELANAYATTLCEHAGDFYKFSELLKNQGLLPAHFSRAASVEYLKIFGLLTDEQSARICPRGSAVSELDTKNLQVHKALKNYSDALEKNADISELQSAALAVCLAGEGASVKADFLLTNCLIKRFEPPKVNEKLTLAQDFLEILPQILGNLRQKSAASVTIGAEKLKHLEAANFVRVEEFFGEKMLFACCEYQQNDVLNSEVLSGFFAAYYAAHQERANSELAELCAAFDEGVNEHGGLLVNFLQCPRVSSILTEQSARAKRLRLAALGFNISDGATRLVAKPGEQPQHLAPSQERLDELAASAVAAAAGLFASGTAKPAVAAEAKKAVKKPVKSAEKPVEKPVKKSANEPAKSAAAEAKPVEKPAEKSVKKPTEKPAKKPAEKVAENPSKKPAEKPAKPAEKPAEKAKQKTPKKPTAQQVASNVAKVQAIKHELGRAEPEQLITELRARKIRPMDLGCPNWAMAFKKFNIFED